MFNFNRLIIFKYSGLYNKNCWDMPCVRLTVFLVHMSWKLKWAFLKACGPFDCPSIFTFFSRTTGPISTKLGTKRPWVKDIQNYLNEDPRPYPRGDNSENTPMKFKNQLLLNHLANFNQTYHKPSLGVGDSSFTNIEHSILKKEIMVFFCS